jgi:hypothetical protein
MIWSNWEGADNSAMNIQWTREYWTAMKPFLKTGSYGNYVSDEGEAVAREAYGANYDRLVTLKNKYDPTNPFRMNHNIKPNMQPVATRTRPFDLGATNRMPTFTWTMICGSSESRLTYVGWPPREISD